MSPQPPGAWMLPAIDAPGKVTAPWVFRRYEELRRRLPKQTRTGAAQVHNDLGALIDRYDAFVFDAFGVLNVGETAIASAANRISALRNAGKSVFVLTNAATGSISSLPGKYRKLGFTFSAREIVSSREVLTRAMGSYRADMRWAVVLPPNSGAEEFDFHARPVTGAETDFSRDDGIILMSSKTIDATLFGRIFLALRDRPRPLLVGNPDIVAPREDGFSLEPGFYAHSIADRLPIEPIFFGKPYENAFDEIKRRLNGAVSSDRIAMVGDTLHTDILGAMAAGLDAVLVTGHGVLKGMDVEDCMKRSGIVPDHVVPSI